MINPAKEEEKKKKRTQCQTNAQKPNLIYDKLSTPLVRERKKRKRLRTKDRCKLYLSVLSFL